MGRRESVELRELRRQARQAELRALRIMRRSANKIDWQDKANAKYNPLSKMGTNWSRQNTNQLRRSIAKLEAFTVRGMVVTQDKKIVPPKLVQEYRRERRRYREKQRRMARKVGEYTPKQLAGAPVKVQPKGVYAKFIGKDIVARPEAMKSAEQLQKYTKQLSTKHEENVRKARKDIVDMVNSMGKKGSRHVMVVDKIKKASPERVAMLRGDTGFMDALHDYYMNVISGEEFYSILESYGL